MSETLSRERWQRPAPLFQNCRKDKGCKFARSNVSRRY
nr:MAG TPA: hypothetical protein [Microviridae sp.]